MIEQHNFYAKLRILKLVDMVFFEKALFVFKFKMQNATRSI